MTENQIADETNREHTLTASSEKAAIKTAEKWLGDGWMVEVRPPDAISSDEWYIHILGWS